MDHRSREVKALSADKHLREFPELLTPSDIHFRTVLVPSKEQVGLLSKRVAKHGVVVPFHAVWIGEFVRALVVGVGLTYLICLLFLLGFVSCAHNGIKTVHHRIEEYAHAKHIAQTCLLAPELSVYIPVVFNSLSRAGSCRPLLCSGSL